MLKLKIVHDKDTNIYSLQSLDGDVIFRSNSFKAVQKMYFDMQLREAASRLNQTLKGQ